MQSKVKVHGRAQSRTVLGIVNAYLLLHPESTLADLDKAFPETLSGRRGDSLFVDIKRKGEFVNDKGESTFEKLFFEREDEVIKLADGTVLAMVEAWTKDDFEKVVEHAKQFGIEVSEFEKTDRPGERGSFWLEGLNGYNVEKAEEEKAAVYEAAQSVPAQSHSEETDHSIHHFAGPVSGEVSSDDSNASCNCKWVPVLLMLLLFLFFMLKACDNGREFVRDCGGVEPEEETEMLSDSLDKIQMLADSLAADSLAKAQAIADSLATLEDTTKDALIEAQNAEEIAKEISDNLKKGMSSSFGNINFEKGSSKLGEASNETLMGIVKFLNENPEAKIKVVGHTSPDGPEDYNIKLSKDRAKSVVDFLEANGIEKARLSFQGVGSRKPISDDPEKNRRVEIKVRE